MSETKTRSEKEHTPYYRRDQRDGITAPDLTKPCTYAEHVVHARGRRTAYTSVSLEAQKIERFGPSLYELRREELDRSPHELVEHDTLIEVLRQIATTGEKAERARALQAQRYARSSREGLVAWKFDVAGVDRKDLISWARRQIQPFFQKLS